LDFLDLLLLGKFLIGAILGWGELQFASGFKVFNAFYIRDLF